MTLHLTSLRPDGLGKAPIDINKRTLAGYPMQGGVVRLFDDAEITGHVWLAEGIEKALALTTAFVRDRGAAFAPQVWSALNASNMSRLPVLPAIERVTVFGDDNQAGRKARRRGFAALAGRRS